MTLVVMAAGMGSRYGGLKQIDPIGPNGEIIIEYSIFDAIEAGFNKVVFIIKKELLDTFKEVIGDKVSKFITVEYVFQETSNLPSGYSLPENRIKPWGTGHAILCASEAVDTDFIVINADDFYGRDSFKKIADFFKNSKSENEYCMAGFKLENTLTENGSVARGICETDKENNLISVTERTEIKKDENGDIVFKNDLNQWEHVNGETLVSMNMWGFKKGIFNYLESLFPEFLDKNLNSPKAEFFIPQVVDTLIKNREISVKVLTTDSQWYGVTYQEDKETVKNAISILAENYYPKKLWGGICE